MTMADRLPVQRAQRNSRIEAEEALARVIAGADLICEGFLLVEVDPELLAWLAGYGAESEDLEEDDPAELNGDEQEPSLGSLDGQENQNAAWSWGLSIEPDLEWEHDGREPGDDEPEEYY